MFGYDFKSHFNPAVVASNGKSGRCVDVFPIGKEENFVAMLDVLKDIRRKCHACGEPHYAIENRGLKSGFSFYAILSIQLGAIHVCIYPLDSIY